MNIRTVAPLFLTAGLLSAAAFAFAACNDDDDASPAPTATAAAVATATSVVEPTATAEGPEDFNGGREPVEGTLGENTGVPPLGTLIDVRTGQHDAFDRVVFEFIDAPPEYRVEYVDEAIGCGSGEAIDVDGAAFLQVRFNVAQAHDDQGELTIDATTIAPGLPSILEAVQTCDFEGVVIWVLGLPEELGFQVTALEAPLRLAVDIAHP
jgi:hypothetical protein